MTNNKQQTAMEWYISKIKEARNFCDDPSMEMDIRHTLEVLIKKGKQAKEMGEEQMIDFAYKALMEADSTVNRYVDVDELYNETYGGDKQ
jgi:hypothetical protein